jgi:hypothetical protein
MRRARIKARVIRLGLPGAESDTRASLELVGAMRSEFLALYHSFSVRRRGLK